MGSIERDLEKSCWTGAGVGWRGDPGGGGSGRGRAEGRGAAVGGRQNKRR